MDPLQLIIEASRADQVLAAQTTDPDLQTALARHRPDLRSALMANPSLHHDLRAWLEDQEAGLAEDAPRGEAEAVARSAPDDSGPDAEDGSPAAGDREGIADDGSTADDRPAGQDEGRGGAGGDGDAGPEGDGGAAADAAGDGVSDDAAPNGLDDVESDGDAEHAEAVDGEEDEQFPDGGPGAAGEPDGESGAGGPDDLDGAGSDDAEPEGAEPEEAADSAQADAPETIGLPAPPPSAQDIAAWAETPSAAPEAYEPPARAVSGSVYAPSYEPRASSPARPRAQGPRRFSTTRLLVGIIVLLLVIIIGGGGALLGSRLSGRHSDEEAGSRETAGADADGAAGAQAAGGIPSATSTGPITSCDTAPAVQVMSVADEQGGLTARVKVTSPCAQGDFLDGAAVRINLYGPSGADGAGLAEAVVASGEFDFSRTPLIIPAEGAALELTYGSGHFFRTAADLAPSSSTRGAESGEPMGTMTGKVLISRSAPTTLGSQGLVSPGAVSAAQTSTDSSGEDAAASAALTWYIEQGRSEVRGSLVGRWTPQLSSKRPGLVAEGRTWDARSALAEFLTLRQEHATAVLVDSDEWPVFEPGQGWWVTLAGLPYSSAEEANAWCDAQGYAPDHCLAKWMDTTGPPEGTIRSR